MFANHQARRFNPSVSSLKYFVFPRSFSRVLRTSWFLLIHSFTVIARLIGFVYCFPIANMFSHFYLSLFAASCASASVIPRQAPNTGPFQTIKVKPDNTFHNGAAQLNAEPPTSNDIPPAVYGARDIDLPFNRLYHGKMKFFSEGQLNSPTGIQDVWHPGQNDYANQSACGIPDNAYSASKVAIHPYFLKYADLSRK